MSDRLERVVYFPGLEGGESVINNSIPVIHNLNRWRCSLFSHPFHPANLLSVSFSPFGRAWRYNTHPDLSGSCSRNRRSTSPPTNATTMKPSQRAVSSHNTHTLCSPTTDGCDTLLIVSECVSACKGTHARRLHFLQKSKMILAQIVLIKRSEPKSPFWLLSSSQDGRITLDWLEFLSIHSLRVSRPASCLHNLFFSRFSLLTCWYNPYFTTPHVILVCSSCLFPMPEREASDATA